MNIRDTIRVAVFGVIYLSVFPWPPIEVRASDESVILLSCYGMVVANVGNRGQAYEYLIRVNTRQSVISYNNESYRANIDAYVISWRVPSGAEFLHNQINRATGSLALGHGIRGSCKKVEKPLF